MGQQRRACDCALCCRRYVDLNYAILLNRTASDTLVFDRVVVRSLQPPLHWTAVRSSQQPAR